MGSLCASYHSTDTKLITTHDWQNCVNVQVTSIYCGLAEFDAGACFTRNECQTLFAEGVFCKQAQEGTTTYEQIRVQVSGNLQH